MEELKLYEGRPADCTGRLEKEIRTYDLLDKLGIQFWRTDHGWMKADTMEDCPPELCLARGYGAVSGLHARLLLHYGPCQ